MKIGLSSLQPLGRALMLPIAVLPVAGLLLRLGQPDLLDIAFVSAAGQAIFSNLGLLFAVGVAVGLARDNNGAAGLAGVVGYLITIVGVAVFLVMLLESAIRRRKAEANPWGEGATTLEWTLSSPPPHHQFNELPVVKADNH